MKSHYDIVVVGAGPAGATAAEYAARAGAAVLLLEKDREVGVPVRCAEGVGEKAFRDFFSEVPSSWISQRITDAVLHAPSGAVVEVSSKSTGLILDRKKFDFDLAHRAVQAGAELYTKANVRMVKIDKKRGAEVQVDWQGRPHALSAALVIGADGVESRVGRWAGLKTSLPVAEIDACCQVLAGPLDLPMHVCHFYFSRQWAPGGYAWVFPKGDNLANIGLGVSGDHCQNQRPYDQLQQFLRHHFPQARQLGFVSGGVPCAKPMKKIVSDRLLLVGDAAHQANPLTGGGIMNALLAGRLAGTIAGQALQEGQTTAERLSEYERLWRQGEGAKLVMSFRLKKFVFSLEDSAFDRLAETTLKLPFEKRTIINIFRQALLKQPSLIWEAVRLFT